MKKLKLNSTAFTGAEMLSRAQLKNVMGGSGSGSGSGDSGNCDDECTSDSDCTTTYPKCKDFVTQGCTNLVKACVKDS